MDVVLEGLFAQWDEGSALLDSTLSQIKVLNAKDPLRHQRSQHPFPLHTRSIEKERLTLAHHIRNDLCRHAEQRFAGGLALVIDPTSLNDLIQEQEAVCQVKLRPDFDPRTLWAELERRFTGSDGVDEACRLAADAFINAVSFDQIGQPVGPVAHFGFNVRQENWVRHEKRYQLSMYCRKDLRRFVKGLRCFLRWADVDPGREEYTALAELDMFLDDQVKQGYAARTKVGNDSLGFRFFKEKGEFWISESLREPMFTFVTGFGTVYRQPGAYCWLREGRPVLS